MYRYKSPLEWMIFSVRMRRGRIFHEKPIDFYGASIPESLVLRNGRSSVMEMCGWCTTWLAHSNAMTGFHAGRAVDVSRSRWRIRSIGSRRRVAFGPVPASVAGVSIVPANIGLRLWPGHVDMNHSTSQRLAAAKLKPRKRYTFP